MPLLEQLLGQYPKDLKIVFKHYPLPSHRFARPAALAAVAAHQQGKFWPFHDRVFAWNGDVTEAKLEGLASELGLDAERFKQDRQARSTQDPVDRDYAEGQRIGVRGTPTLFVNGRAVRNRSPEGIGAMIQEELRKRSAK